MPSSRPDPEARAGDDRTTDLIRWAAFTCVLVPVVLLWCGTSLAGAAGTALGLAAVTAACRLLLRRSERYAARTPTGHHGPHGTPGPQQSSSAHRALGTLEPLGALEPQESPETHGAHSYGQGASAPYGPRHGRRRRTGTGSHRGGRHSGGSTPVS